MRPDVIDQFLDVSARDPDRVAISAGKKTMSYGELERRVRSFAGLFSTRAAPRVLLALPRGLDAYAAALAVGLAGGYYTPVNEISPASKLRNICARLEPDFIVALPALGAALSKTAPSAVLITPGQADSAMLFAGRGSRHALAYIIFTSGSTGEPKGVVISRHALNIYIGWVRASETIIETDRVAQFSNLAFDMSILDIYGALSQGATLVPISRQSDRLMPARAIRREGITSWSSVPSVVSLMIRANQLTAENLASMRLFTFAGEALQEEHVAAILAARPDLPVQNLYGPTEATVTVTGIMLNPENYRDLCDRSVTIGPAIPGMAIHLVGGPTWDEGQIAISGPQVAQGYWRDPGRSAEVFRDYETEDGPRNGYLTGDWAIRRNGLIYFRERMDFQVKHHGFRIELDEIAAAIRSWGLETVCVFKHGDSLIALAESSRPCEERIAQLKEWLLHRLEAYAVPDRFEFVDRLPRNENDKIDRRAAAELIGMSRRSLPRSGRSAAIENAFN